RKRRLAVRASPSRWATTRRQRYPFFLAGRFATSRACSMNSRAAGLSVRFFRVTIPTGAGADGSSTGKTLNLRRPPENLNTEGGKVVRKRRLAMRFIGTSLRPANREAGGYGSPLAAGKAVCT